MASLSGNIRERNLLPNIMTIVLFLVTFQIRIVPSEIYVEEMDNNNAVLLQDSALRYDLTFLKRIYFKVQK